MATKAVTINTDAEGILVYLQGTKHATERTKRAIRDACHLNGATRADTAFKQLISASYIEHVGDSTYELTQTGKKAAANISKQSSISINQSVGTVEGGTVTFSGADNPAPALPDIMATPLSYDSLFANPQGRTTQSAKRIEAGESAIERTLDQPGHDLPIYNIHPLRMSAALLDTSHPGTNGNGNGSSAAAKNPVIVRFLLAFEKPKDVLPIPVVHNDVLGRSRNANIWLRHDNFISNKHCRFEIRRDSTLTSSQYNLYVEDLGSTNGTCIDDVPLEEGKQLLRHGSRITVGNTVLIVVHIPY